jgi:uncharacterized protein (UPF0248 family)
MQTVKELINKIRWDKREHQNEYEIGILDRFTKEIGFIPFSSVKSVEGQFMTITHEDETTEIPLHRIRAVRKSGKVVWKRKGFD